MKKYIYLFIVSIALISFTSCEDTSTEALDTSFASFATNGLDIGVEEGSETASEIKVYTTNVVNSDRNITVMVDEDLTDAESDSYDLPATVLIPAGSNEGILSLVIKDVGLELSTDKSLVLRLESTNETLTGAALKIGLSKVCPNNGIKLKVKITLDDYPEEAAWRILDANGNTVMASASPFAYGAYRGLEGVLTSANCLATGTYTMQVYDGYADGGTGYEVRANGVLVFSASGDYGGFVDGTFTL